MSENSDKKLKESVKKANPTKRRVPKPKRESIYYTTKELMGWRDHDPGYDFAQALGDRMLEQDAKSPFMDIIEFLIWYGIPQSTYYKLKKKYEPIQAAHDMLKLKIAARRERAARDRSEDSRTIVATLHHYHPTWRKMMDEHNDLKRELKRQETDNKPTEITVVMDNYSPEDSGLDPIDMA